MKAQEARQISTREQERQESEKRAREGQGRRDAEGEAAERLPGRIRYIDQQIKKEAAGGYLYLETRSDVDEVSHALAGMISRHYQNLGYIVSWKTEKSDMGDSAAPCIIEERVLTLSWKA